MDDSCSMFVKRVRKQGNASMVVDLSAYFYSLIVASKQQQKKTHFSSLQTCFVYITTHWATHMKEMLFLPAKGIKSVKGRNVEGIRWCAQKPVNEYSVRTADHHQGTLCGK